MLLELGLSVSKLVSKVVCSKRRSDLPTQLFADCVEERGRECRHLVGVRTDNTG